MMCVCVFVCVWVCVHVCVYSYANCRVQTSYFTPYYLLYSILLTLLYFTIFICQLPGPDLFYEVLPESAPPFSVPRLRPGWRVYFEPVGRDAKGDVVEANYAVALFWIEQG